MSDSPSMWNIVIKVAVEAADEYRARSVVDLVLESMEVTGGEVSPFIQFDDGTWAAEVQVQDATFDRVEPADVMSILACLKANLGPVTWRGVTNAPQDPDSADAGQIEWPPGYWALAGRRETLVDPSVRAVLLQAHRTHRRETTI